MDWDMVKGEGAFSSKGWDQGKSLSCNHSQHFAAQSKGKKKKKQTPYSLRKSQASSLQVLSVSEMKEIERTWNECVS